MESAGRRQHARLIRRSDHGTEDALQDGTLADMAKALFALPAELRGYHYVETIDGQYEEQDLIDRLRSGELEG